MKVTVFWITFVVLMVAPPGDCIMCYECSRCNSIVRTWKHVNCSGSCLTKEITHKFAKPNEASRRASLLHFLSILYNDTDNNTIIQGNVMVVAS